MERKFRVLHNFEYDEYDTAYVKGDIITASELIDAEITLIDFFENFESVVEEGLTELFRNLICGIDLVEITPMVVSSNEVFSVKFIEEGETIKSIELTDKTHIDVLLEVIQEEGSDLYLEQIDVKWLPQIVAEEIYE